jgi:hypothetical protein
LHWRRPTATPGVCSTTSCPDAWSGGGAAVEGRLEPRLVEPVASRRCVTIYRGGSRAQARDREIVGAFASGDSLPTRLASEWWL